MAPMLRRAAGLVIGCWGAFSSVSADPDAASLVQGSVRTHAAGGEEARTRKVSQAVVNTAEGPVVQTELGPIIGKRESTSINTTYLLFSGVPYAEPPKRFAPAEPKKPWGPAAFSATTWGHACIGSNTKIPESEDCLNLHIWVPDGGHKDMPVIVYFHGGMNQHGSGQEELRQGDLLVASSKFPTIFVNFDYRLGIFGWIDMQDPAVPKNIGIRDQQLALRWVNRNIAAFGGDPKRVMLMGQSEGSGTIVDHLVAPGSQGLFSRISMHSPPAELWRRDVNRKRTDYMIDKLKCRNPSAPAMIECLRRYPAAQLWGADWVVEELSRNMFSPAWQKEFKSLLGFIPGKNIKYMPGYIGWHAVVDGDIIPGEPQELIQSGRWSHVPVLMTTAKNESLGCFPNGDTSAPMLSSTLWYFLKEGDTLRMADMYQKILKKNGHGVPAGTALLHQLVTDKVWACDILSFATDVANSGGEVRLGVFAHPPKWDPTNIRTNAVCQAGASCHAADTLYILPQDPARGGIPSSWSDDWAFAQRYRDELLKYASGGEAAWVPYESRNKSVTFYNLEGPSVVQGWKQDICHALDTSMGEALPSFMQDRARFALHAK